MTLFDDLWRLWKVFINYSLVENEHLKRIMFHVLIKSILTQRKCGYIQAAKHMSVRFHTFMIQDSGTGKGISMENVEAVLQKMGIPVRKTLKDNDSASVGTVWQDKKTGQFNIKYGHLANIYCYMWSEGRVLLRGSQWMEDAADHFQMAMDEPGEFSKSLAMKDIKGKTDATLVAGSYEFDEFRRTLMQRGFLQRMYVLYKEFTPTEKRNLRIGVINLKKLTDRTYFNKLQDALVIQLPKFPSAKYITFEPRAVDAFQHVMEEAYKKYIEFQFDSKRQRVLETFWNRVNLLIDKLAAQRALINGQDTVTLEDLMYGFDVVCSTNYIPNPHIKNIHEIMIQMYSREINVKGGREGIIMTMLKERGQMNLSQIMEELKKLKEKNMWDLGSGKSREIIKDLVDVKRKLIEVQGSGATKIIKLAEEYK